MATEISGGGHLAVGQRLRYPAFNLSRNLKPGKCAAQRLRLCAGRRPRSPSTASPGRTLTESFLYSQLQKMLPPGKPRGLEIGSGSLTKRLTQFGYCGTYIGVDIADRFNRTVQPSLQMDFVWTDAHRFETEEEFDLFISVSALEHMPNDLSLIKKLRRLVAPPRLQGHLVPSGWGLLTYLWHGYRQYAAASLGQRFYAQHTTIYAMGGAARFFAAFPGHFGWRNSAAAATEGAIAPTLRLDARSMFEVRPSGSYMRNHVRCMPNCCPDVEQSS